MRRFKKFPVLAAGILAFGMAVPPPYMMMNAYAAVQDTQQGTEAHKTNRDIVEYAQYWAGKVHYNSGSEQLSSDLYEGGASDCSWFVYAVLHHFGYMQNYARSVEWGAGQVPGTTKIDGGIKNARPGDIEFWDEGNNTGHVAIYMGNGKAIACNGYFTEAYKQAHGGHVGEVEVTDYKTTIGRDPDSIWRVNAVPDDYGVKQSGGTFSDANYKVLGNMIGAVESGGQIYGNKRYSAYAGAHQNSDKEVTCTLGWAQFYGNEAERLVQMIFDKDPAAFRKIDTGKVIEKKLGTNWVLTKWNPSTSQKNTLIKLITTDVGKACQDELFTEVIKPKVVACETRYTTDPKAVAMYVEISHLGGKTPAQRIFNACKDNYDVDHILSVLKLDQKDTSNNNQVGDTKFWTRHVKCAEWAKKYIQPNNNGTAQITKPNRDADSTIYGGWDFSPVYDYQYYIDHNPDVKNAFSGDKLKTFSHFINNGMSEGRRASKEFDPAFYRSHNGDLNGAFGNTMRRYYLHYLENGKREGRLGAAPEVHTHTWDAGVVTKQPTCTEAGVKTYTCSGCKQTKTESVPALGHDWSDWKEDGSGKLVRTCSRCGQTETKDAPLAFNSQPQDALNVESGKLHEFKISVNRPQGTTYQWQILEPGKSWRDFTEKKTAKTDGLNFTITDSMDNWQLRCVAKNGSETITSNPVTITIKSSFAFTEQPQNAANVESGKLHEFKVSVNRPQGASYQWQVMEPGKDWRDFTEKQTAKTNDLNFTITNAMNNWQLRCVVKNGNDTVTSNAVTITVKSSLVITSQPKEETVEAGKLHKYSVESNGVNPKYQWQVSENGGKSFRDFTEKQTASTKEAYFTVTNNMNGWKLRCRVTDGGNTVYSNVITIRTKQQQVEAIPVYRVYNPRTGEHFYTTNGGERDSLSRSGWKYEGIAWYAGKTGSPVYRLCNPNTGEHHYTTGAGEKNALVKAGWRYEGISWYAGGSKPVYREYNPNARVGSHNYTTNLSEHNSLIKAGWRNEGIAFYSVK